MKPVTGLTSGKGERLNCRSSPDFQNDLFVSYAHNDDPPWMDRPGWVTEFIQALKDGLKAKSRDFTLWFDPKLRTGEDFNDAIGEAIASSAVFLCVLSPAYDDSTYCKKEVAAFRERRHPSFGIKVGTMSRIQALVLDALPQDKWPPDRLSRRDPGRSRWLE